MWVKHRCISKSLDCTFWRPLTRISIRILYGYLVRNCVHAKNKICARQFKTIVHAPLCDDWMNQRCDCHCWNEKRFDKNCFPHCAYKITLDRWSIYHLYIMSSSVITSHRCHRISSLYLSHYMIITYARTFLTHQTF